MLVNDVSLRAFAGREMKTGFGWVQAKPATSFSPVAVDAGRTRGCLGRWSRGTALAGATRRRKGSGIRTARK